MIFASRFNNTSLLSMLYWSISWEVWGMMRFDNRYEIIDCICCWYDLLGFGAPFINSEWNLRDPICESNYTRLKTVGNTFNLNLNVFGTTIYINDGIATTIDIGDNNVETINKAMYYLESVFLHFRWINAVEQDNGYPGARGVITCGHRMHYETTDIDVYGINGDIIAYHPIEFQMNTAFSKASIMEESGKASGLKGPNMFIDSLLFELLDERLKGIEGYSVEVIKDYSDRLKVIINANFEWFLRLYLDPEPIIYKNKGINTKIYRLLKYESYLDWYARNHPSPLGRLGNYDDDDDNE